ncbi:hypothetical protein NI17_005735 [Thermobifida halotolerans]|uniref:Asp23/Gls24 family envelope stress response protein n=1 Tax=Thermobifida halotolerans TaxID=483545 RepID=A0AA97LZ59_9ACTN|nr:hypothetical protein [Thermobifida halotolerans]UOE20703.1 hypothetical protein NI17_005735 [Thermobifida halotolerans]
MSTTTAQQIAETAARVALAVPGVVGLQPRPGEPPDGDGARRRCDHTVDAEEADVRVDRPDGWHVEVRCVLDGRLRALDVARAVRASVTTRLLTGPAYLAPVSVSVVVTRIALPAPAATAAD